MGKVIKKYLRKLVYLFTYNFYVKPSLNRKTSVKYSGFDFTIYPTVFNLRYSVSSRVFASYIGSLDLNKKKILDMGCGTGVVSVIAASKGAVCTAVDINPMAVKSASENAAANGFGDKIKVFGGNLFSAIPFSISYDIIFFNPPYYKGTPANDFERAFKGGDNYEVIGEFLKTAREYLSSEGYICMIISSDMGLNDFINLAVSYSYKFEILLQKEKLFETFYIVKLV